MLRFKSVSLILAALLAAASAAWAQTGARIASDELVYNFGTIGEADGYASHVFVVKNTGDAPLVITRVTASCGCTRPEWTKAPIEPGKSGEVKVTYNPKGRPGPFYKTVSIFSNGKRGSYSLAIKGSVTPKPVLPVITYPYAFGDLKLSAKNVLFSSVRHGESVGEKIHVKNEGKTAVTLAVGKLPRYLTAHANPETIRPGEEGEIGLLMNTQEVKRKGHAVTQLRLHIRFEGEKERTGEIRVAANVIDNFGKRSASEKERAPRAELSGTLLEFGKLPNKRSIVPLVGGKVSGTFEITNAGKQPLVIYSVTCDDERVDLSGGKRELKPGATTLYKVSLRPKEIKTKLEALITVVCDDPSGPIRFIKVTAYK